MEIKWCMFGVQKQIKISISIKKFKNNLHNAYLRELGKKCVEKCLFFYC